MKPIWQLQEAKNRFSELVDTALETGPQTVTRRGKPTVVVMSLKDYEELNPSPQRSMLDWLRSCPTVNDELADLIDDRIKDAPREFEFES